uniref:Integrase catalytic domain-containing protein n=1 Tax=Meloidogyne enterolobii TaxID=390850 RepID=A0A6V7X8F6_MELEN|nr:unnamed protein product [Meloidogyne enterolobii]
MSGTIRSTIAPSIVRLKKYLEEVRPVIDATERTEEGIELLQRMAVKIRRAINFVEEKVEKWEKYIKDLPANERVAEEGVFARYAIEERHFLEWIDSGREAIDDIEIVLAEGSDARSTQSEISEEIGVGLNRTNEVRRNINAERVPVRSEQVLPPHLPRTRLPEFYGDTLRWPEFWQAFERTVDCLNIDNGLKAHYLIQCLRGKARRAILGYRPIAEHYVPLKDALIRQFGNEKAIRDTLHAELISLPVANESIWSLRSYLEEVERICRSLTAMGQLEDESIVMMAIKNKLPRSIVLELLKMEKLEKVNWSVGRLREGLAEIVALREEAQRCTRSLAYKNSWQNVPNLNQRRFNGNTNNQRKPEPARVFTAPKNQKREISCLFCNGPHLAGNCKQVRFIGQRMSILSEQNRCLICLRKGHAKIDCNVKYSCGICKGDHNKIICPKEVEKEKKGQIKENESVNQISENMLNIDDNGEDNIVLMKADLMLKERNNKINAKCFFDSGATVNFLCNELVEKLKLKKLKRTELGVVPFFRKEPIKLKTSCYSLKVLLDNGNFEEIIVYSINKNLMPRFRCADLRTNEIACANIVPDMLIGMKHFWRFFKRIEPLSDYLFKVETTVGPIICGEISGEKFKRLNKKENLCTILSSNTLENEELNNYWSLETIGVKDDPVCKDDKVALDLFNSTIKRNENGSYIVKWPWKIEKDNLPSNFSLAYKRFLNLMDKLKKNPDLLNKYEEIINNDLKRGVIEKAERKKSEIEHFLPHHPVINTKKVRIVYDASAKMREGKSLNECLYRGPIIMPDLAGLLIRFRVPKIAMWADIEKAFHTLELEEEDREVTKFIWVKDTKKPISTQNIQYLRFAKVPFGVISSPFLLSATVRHHLEKCDDPVAKIAKENSYVDNIFIGIESANEAWLAYKRLKEIFKDAQMNLREFISNNMELNESFPLEDRLEKNKPKILGIPWDISTDKINIVFPKVELNEKITKRIVLSELASMFDPLGLASPSLLSAKLFFQSLWTKENKWDDKISEENTSKWKEITNSWIVDPIEINRRVTDIKGEKQLHAFSDASKCAYAACIYIKSKFEGRIHTQILYARNRLKPRKAEVTIPRMELLGVVIAKRALEFVEKQIGVEIKDKFLWCDSKPVLSWIKAGGKNEKFIENRINEIRKNNGIKFGYVNTIDNPADIATRGIMASELEKCHIWWEGPDWLKRPENNWPNELNFEIEKEDTCEEDNQELILSCLNKKIDEEDNLINFNNWNSWNKLIKCLMFVTIAARIWIEKSRKIVKGKFLSEINLKNRMSANNFKKVEIFVLKIAQSSYKNEKNDNLQTIIDENGLIRLKTRIGNCEAEDYFKHPIVLPKGCFAVKLLLRKIHEELSHSGVDSTVANFLMKFWTPCARRITKIVIKECKKCQRISSPKFALPDMPILPRERVRQSRPFEFVGVDYLGPSMCKIEGGKVKFWIALFTCLSTRGIHLDLITDLSALSFLDILRRFVAQRGAPLKIISDNGNQFITVAKVINANIEGKWKKEKANNDEKLFNNFLLEKEIEWKFIPALSPWQGGVYERLVKLVKDSFKRSLGSRILNIEELRTFIKEVEMSINCRPISYISLEKDGPLCLRPIDFIIPRVEIIQKFPEIEDDNFRLGKTSTAEQVQERWMATLKTLQRFWDTWKRDYLIMLRDKSKWTHHNQRNDLKRNPRIGEVVIVHQEGQPRNVWPLGKIVELDGTPARSAKIKIGDKTFIRPINKISPLEIEDENIVEENLNNENEKENEVDLSKKETKKLETKNKNTHPMVTRSKVALCLQFVQLIYMVAIAFAEPPRYINCKGCFMKCRTFGVEANAVDYINKIELCCAGSCLLEINGLSRLAFKIPKDKTALDYKCRATYWGKRYMYRDWISCPAVDPCIRISGLRERIVNPQCESLESLLLIGIVAGFILTIILSIALFACKLLLIFGKLLKIIWNIVKMPMEVFFAQKKNRQKDITENYY